MLTNISEADKGICRRQYTQFLTPFIALLMLRWRYLARTRRTSSPCANEPSRIQQADMNMQWYRQLAALTPYITTGLSLGVQKAIPLMASSSMNDTAICKPEDSP